MISETTAAEAARHIRGATIAWANGKVFDVLNPEQSAKDVTIREYGFALAFTPRWRGQTFGEGMVGRVESAWSVLDHVVEGASAMLDAGEPKSAALGFLGHESDEVVFGDTAGPLKQFWTPEFRAIVARVGDAFDARFGFPCEEHKETIKRWDIRMLVTEKRDLLLGHHDATFSIDGTHMADERYQPLPRRLRMISPHARYHQFFGLFERLGGRM